MLTEKELAYQEKSIRRELRAERVWRGVMYAKIAVAFLFMLVAFGVFG